MCDEKLGNKKACFSLNYTDRTWPAISSAKRAASYRDLRLASRKAVSRVSSIQASCTYAMGPFARRFVGVFQNSPAGEQALSNESKASMW